MKTHRRLEVVVNISVIRFALLCILLLVLARPIPAFAALPEDTLLDRGIEAYHSSKFMDALMYLFAYQERDPLLLRENPPFRQQLIDAVTYSRQKLESERRELESLRTRVAEQARRGNIGSTVSGLTRAPPPLTRPLVAPEQVSPSAGAVFNFFPRTTVLTWRPVRGASTYMVEVDCFHCCQSGRWCSEVGKSYILAKDIRGTRYQFGFAGAQPGRWRVWAVDTEGRRGPTSPWREFRYTK